MEEKCRPRILVADDHPLVAEALKKLLEPQYPVIATVYDGRSLIRSAEELKPDVLVIDIGLPLLNGLEAGQRIKRTLPNAKLVYITSSQDALLAAECLHKGGSAFLTKTSAGSDLLLAIRAALAGEQYCSIPTDRRDTQEADRALCTPQRRARGVTERQIDVLQLLAEGKSMKEIAAILRVATRTVAFHKYRLMRSLKLGSDAELVMYAIQRRLIFE